VTVHRTTRGGKSALATIAAMPKLLRPVVLAVMLAAFAAAASGCGNSGPDPSVPPDNSQSLLAKLAEIKANVDVGSCLVAASKTDDFLADVQNLPSSVNQDVRDALESGANNLKLLLNDPTKCQGRSEPTISQPTTTTPSTTEPTTTKRTEPTTTTPTQTQPTTTTPTQPTTPTTPGASGGIGPGGL
jgi:hypothetical protein